MAIQGKNANVSYDARSNFGKKGWGVVVFSGVNWYIMGMLAVSMMNVVVPVFAGKLQVAEGTLLSMNTVAGLIGVIFASLAGALVPRFGVKTVNGIALLLTAVAVFCLGSATSFAGYCIALICMRVFVFIVQQAGGDMSIGNWFPKKKGLAIGWSTMGVSLSSATVVTAISAMMGILGDIKYALWVVAGFVLLVCICNFAFFKNYPEECGAYPDNDPTAKRRESGALRTGWTIRKALKVKEVWFMAIGVGSMAMIVQGFMSTLVPNMLMHGYPEGIAMMMISVASVFAIFGSWFFGWLDQKFGTQKSCLMFCACVFLGIVCYFIPVRGFIWGFLLLVGVAIGAASNYTVSIAAQMFGRDGFVKVFPVIFFLVECIAMLCSVILGQSLNRTGSYAAAWVIFGILMVISFILFYIGDFSPRKDPVDLEKAEDKSE